MIYLLSNDSILKYFKKQKIIYHFKLIDTKLELDLLSIAEKKDTQKIIHQSFDTTMGDILKSVFKYHVGWPITDCSSGTNSPFYNGCVQ